MNKKENLRFVLVRTTHPGNIGASARAIKNMGFKNLYLVSPLSFPHEEAIARSSGAEDILENAIVVDSLHEAVADCHLILGTSARDRYLPWQQLTAHESALKIKDTEGKVAILFGQERTGLTNEELSLCHYHVQIPCNPSFASLNLAAAVQVMAYELRTVLLNSQEKNAEQIEPVDAKDMERFYDHLEQTLVQIGFLDARNPRLLMKKLRLLFNRAEVKQNEMNILRGILTAINKQK